MSVVASLVVHFGAADDAAELDAEDAILQAEIDDRPSGYNGGRVQFRVGDSPAYLVFTHRANITEQLASDGQIVDLGPGLVEVEEFLIFADTTEATLSHPWSGWIDGDEIADHVRWHGADGGSLQIDGARVIRTNTAVRAAVAQIRYTASFSAFRVEGLSVDTRRLLILVLGEPQ